MKGMANLVAGLFNSYYEELSQERQEDDGRWL
jgi:hypothetical protein